MIKEIKKLLESLFDDDYDELFKDDNIGMTTNLLEDDARKIREQLLKGMVVSDDDLELVCQDAFKYKVKDFSELVHIIADIKKQLYKDKVVNDLYDIKEIVDNTNIEYYIKRELLSLDIKYEEFNSYTGWNINEFKKFLLNINNEINKIKQN